MKKMRLLRKVRIFFVQIIVIYDFYAKYTSHLYHEGTVLCISTKWRTYLIIRIILIVSCN